MSFLQSTDAELFSVWFIHTSLRDISFYQKSRGFSAAHCFCKFDFLDSCANFSSVFNFCVACAPFQPFDTFSSKHGSTSDENATQSKLDVTPIRLALK